ncbi:hypothetical protein GCM10010451_45570 [Streptomyces virens]|uniref:Uncharacterized protein n=1 Tax=Streptomyces virens TaxID=285572 RepID=A0ABP6PUA9_9ACTN
MRVTEVLTQVDGQVRGGRLIVQVAERNDLNGSSHQGSKEAKGCSGSPHSRPYVPCAVRGTDGRERQPAAASALRNQEKTDREAEGMPPAGPASSSTPGMSSVHTGPP